MIGVVDHNGPPRRNSIPMTPQRRSVQRPVSIEDSPRPTRKYEVPSETISPRRRIVRIRPNSACNTRSAKVEPMTTLYRHAKEQAWDQVTIDCRTHAEEASYVCPNDGTNALHLAVMSRVGYSLETEQIMHPAPLSIIEELLQAYPDAAKVKCNINTYTPLAYACLVSGPDCCLEETDELVRLFLEYCPESTSVYTKGGLSAVDVHVVSYSQVMRGKDEEGTHLSGRTSTVVLRTLLESNPSLASMRISEDKLGGPIEILYRCNSQAFLKFVARYETKLWERPTHQVIRTTAETADNNKTMLAQISNWWVWRWTIIILKYEILPKKKKGARFFALQAASGLVGCPLPILILAMTAFPNQIKEKDEMHNAVGNLPLHEVCSWPCDDSASMDPVISSRKGMAISALLQRYPNAAFICNNNEQTPLDLALSSGTTWDGGVRKLVAAYPAAASIRNSSSGLFPFMTAAVVAHTTESNIAPLPSTKRSLLAHLKNMAKRDVQTVRTIYGLLRADPNVMIPDDDDDDSSSDDESTSSDEELMGQQPSGWVDFGDASSRA